MNPAADIALSRSRRVLNTGSGPADNARLHAAFRGPGWVNVRLDADPAVQPDILGTVVDLSGVVPDGSFDAVWSSHCLEHLHAHEVGHALRECARVLRDDGFALITCPDLESVAALLLERGLDEPVYRSPAGPIAVADMLFGHRASVAAGNGFMAHRTGFTTESLGQALTAAGFPEVRVGRGTNIDLWALATKAGTRLGEVEALLRGSPEAFLLA